MLTSTFQSRKSQRSAQHRSRSACDAFSNLTRHSQSLGLNPFNVAGDGHCFFRTLSITLIDLLGSKAAKILVQADCSHAAVRDFLCSWAEQHHDVIIDDEGEETLAQRAADAALAWDRPLAAIDDDGRAIPVEPRFADVLARMRDSEWADECWVHTVAPAALGFQISVISSEGEAYDRPPQHLPESGCRTMRCASSATWPSATWWSMVKATIMWSCVHPQAVGAILRRLCSVSVRTAV